MWSNIFVDSKTQCVITYMWLPLRVHAITISFLVGSVLWTQMTLKQLPPSWKQLAASIPASILQLSAKLYGYKTVQKISAVIGYSSTSRHYEPETTRTWIQAPLQLEPLEHLLSTARECLDNNFLSSFFTLVGSIMVFHYTSILVTQGECPLILCYSRGFGTGMFWKNTDFLFQVHWVW